VLVAYAAKTGTLSWPLFILYIGLIFWTVGYDTIYACQDIEDDMKIGVKSTARRFGKKIKLGVSISYAFCLVCIILAMKFELPNIKLNLKNEIIPVPLDIIVFGIPSIFGTHLLFQVINLKPNVPANVLGHFKSNFWAAFYLIIGLSMAGYFSSKSIYY